MKRIIPTKSMPVNADLKPAGPQDDVHNTKDSSTISGKMDVLPAFKGLADRIAGRLSFMKAVAAYKWVHQLPIENRLREKMFIRKSMDSAKKYQLDPLSTRQFFEQQILSAKIVQQYWFRQWERNGFEASAYQELNEDTIAQPTLLELNEEILHAIRQLGHIHCSEEDRQRAKFSFMNQLAVTGLNAFQKSALFQAGMQIRSITAN